MATSFNITAIAKLLKLTERRVQQLAKDDIIPSAKQLENEVLPSPKNIYDAVFTLLNE